MSNRLKEKLHSRTTPVRIYYYHHHYYCGRFSREQYYNSNSMQYYLVVGCIGTNRWNNSKFENINHNNTTKRL